MYTTIFCILLALCVFFIILMAATICTPAFKYCSGIAIILILITIIVDIIPLFKKPTKLLIGKYDFVAFDDGNYYLLDGNGNYLIKYINDNDYVVILNNVSKNDVEIVYGESPIVAVYILDYLDMYEKTYYELTIPSNRNLQNQNTSY